MYQQSVSPADAVECQPAPGLPTVCVPEVGEAAIERGDILSLPRVLARIPDLDAVEAYCEGDPSPEDSAGRIIKQGFSTKLLLTAMALLVLAAFVPLTRMKTDATNSANQDKPAPPAVTPTAVAEKTCDPNGPTVHIPQAPQIPHGVVSGPQPTPAPAAPQLISGTTPNAISNAAPNAASNTAPNGASPAALPPNAAGSNAVAGPGNSGPPADAAAAGPLDASPWPDPQRSPPINGAARMISPPDGKAGNGGEMVGPTQQNPGRYEVSRPGPVYSDSYRGEPRQETSLNQPMATGGPAWPMPPGTRTAEPALVPPAPGDGSMPWPPGAPGAAPAPETTDKPSIRTDYDRARSSLH